MNIFPKIKECPNCNSVNIIKTNGIMYENNFKILKGWILKKIFNCRKCNIQLGLFFNNDKANEKKVEKLVWLELLNCEEFYYNQLKKLEEKKEKFKREEKKFIATNNEIRIIQNKIRSDQVKVKVKIKIKNHIRGMLVGDAY